MASQLQEASAARALSLKVSDFPAELAVKTDDLTSARYRDLAQMFNDENIKDAVGILTAMRNMINEKLENRGKEEQMKEFLS